MTLINNIKGILKTKNLDEETIYSVLNAVGKIWSVVGTSIRRLNG